MASVSITNLDGRLKSRLRIQAAAVQGHSMEDEAPDIMRSSLNQEPKKFGTATSALFSAPICNAVPVTVVPGPARRLKLAASDKNFFSIRLAKLGIDPTRRARCRGSPVHGEPRHRAERSAGGNQGLISRFASCLMYGSNPAQLAPGLGWLVALRG